MAKLSLKRVCVCVRARVHAKRSLDQGLAQRSTRRSGIARNVRHHLRDNLVL